MYLEMPKEKVSKGECYRERVRARKCNITSSSAADNKGAVVREAGVVQRPLTQDINQFGQVQYQFKLNSQKHS